jgi:two-component system OmpR family sensor kinase
MASIRRWLLLALLALLGSVGVVGGALTYGSARAEVDLLLDEELRQVALSLRDLARLDTERIERSAETPEQRLLVQVDDLQRGQPYRSRDVAPLPPAAGEGFRDLDHAGQSWRVYALPHAGQVIQVAQPIAQRRTLALRITLRVLTPLLLLMPVAAALLWWIVGRAMRPLDALGAQLAQRQPSSLAPLALDRLPQEARPLVSALNDLLARLQAAFEQQRSLTADAAHALRTPLAAVTLQAQLARRAAEGSARDAALDRLEAGVKRASHLVAQLLALARLDPDAARDPAVPIDLVRLAQEAAAEVQPLAESAQLDVELSMPAAAPIRGHDAALRMAVTNLLDNAVRYTPAGGRIAVTLGADAGGYRLAVSDTGRGLPADERERVFDRFYRGRDTATPGSGLGLAIVREVARLHGGRAWIEDGPGGRGLTVSLWLPGQDGWTPAQSPDAEP